MKTKFFILLMFALVIGFSGYSQNAEIQKAERVLWWKDAGFGMFIHWGLYSIPAGEWKGKDIPGIGEWIMKHAQIPVKEYRELAKQFNPVKFDAKTWVKIAKDAGMKYIVITSKHHDGFAMFKSDATPYNIVDATLYGKDPIKALADECHKQGIKIGFYYSQSRDWNEPNGLDNTWDFTRKRNFQKYLDEKVKPQLTELLTHYGPVSLIFFDTPLSISHEQASELKALVRKLQPECIISGRLGGGVETDYASTGDNDVPLCVERGYWEVPATLNNTWGYKVKDNNWKSPFDVTRLLYEIAGGGGNYLLNVGPTSEGVIPEASVKILKKVGIWMKRNGEAIYGTDASPYKAGFPWGTITTKGHKLYLGFFRWPQNQHFSLDGLKSKVSKVYLLVDPEKKVLNFKQHFNPEIAHSRLTIDLPVHAPDVPVSVVVVECEDYPEVEDIPAQMGNKEIYLSACYALPIKDNQPAYLKLCSRGGGVANWTDTKISLFWDFKVEQPGTYKLDVISNETGSHGSPVWQGGHVISIDCNGQEQKLTIRADKKEFNPRQIYWKEIHTYGGIIKFDKPGSYILKVSLIRFNDTKMKNSRYKGFTLSNVHLIPEK